MGLSHNTLLSSRRNRFVKMSPPIEQTPHNELVKQASALETDRQAALNAFLELGKRYAMGCGGPSGTQKNYDLAIKWWENAAKQAVPEAFLNIGRLYGQLYEKSGKLEQLTSALKAFQVVSDPQLNLPEASFSIGLLMDKFARKCLESEAMGKKKRLQTSFDAFQKAAEHYSIATNMDDRDGRMIPAHAANLLADLYEEGRGVDKDISKAFALRLKAAKAGFAEAQYDISIMFYNGDGVKRSLPEARHWLECARTQEYFANPDDQQTFSEILSKIENEMSAAGLFSLHGRVTKTGQQLSLV